MSPEPCIPCRTIVELVTDYLEGALPADEHARFESHVGACTHCAAYVEQIRVTLRVVGRIGPGELDPALERGLLDAFRAPRGEA
jgi:anti-sigma factor RsiW